MDLEVLFEDVHLAVLVKPAGLLSQGEETGEENLVDLLRVRFGRNYVGLVHRLDRNVSGVMVVAKRTKSARRLTESLQRGTLIRRYVCLVEGTVTANRAGTAHSGDAWLTLTHWLTKNETTNLSLATREKPMGLSRQDGPPKQATLRYRRIADGKVEGKPVSLLEVDLETGRSHQIRAQLAAEGHPLVGDVKYGASRGLPGYRIGLHSHFISFPHPMTEAPVQFQSELPQDLSRLAFAGAAPRLT